MRSWKALVICGFLTVVVVAMGLVVPGMWSLLSDILDVVWKVLGLCILLLEICIVVIGPSVLGWKFKTTLLPFIDERIDPDIDLSGVGSWCS